MSKCFSDIRFSFGTHRNMNEYEPDYGEMYEVSEQLPYPGECRNFDDGEYEYTEEGYWIEV